MTGSAQSGRTQSVIAPERHVAVSPSIAQKAVAFLRCAITSVIAWRTAQIPNYCRPDEDVMLESDDECLTRSSVFLSLGAKGFSVSGSMIEGGRQLHVAIRAVRPVAGLIGSVSDRPAIIATIETWIERLISRPHQDLELIEQHRRRLSELVEAAAYATLSSWDDMIVYPYVGQMQPGIWDKYDHPAYSPEVIEYRPNDTLMNALVRARDPFIHMRQGTTSNYIYIDIGGTEPITVVNARSRSRANQTRPGAARWNWPGPARLQPACRERETDSVDRWQSNT